ncbi:hypothetical protein [Haloglomus litoreum]|uniref:hypothetical protein n=1 Tax=Haloglomus litoreum TaxID=3034026 RepID=UPI0023E818C7|nr:hypothetical protein [Haloglomus sp. DT116]
MNDDGTGTDERAGGGQPADDPERAAMLREVAREVRDDSDEAERVAAILFRVSDLYDPDEETDPESIYRNMRTILRVTERGTLERDRDGK